MRFVKPWGTLCAFCRLCATALPSPIFLTSLQLFPCFCSSRYCWCCALQPIPERGLWCCSHAGPLPGDTAPLSCHHPTLGQRVSRLVLCYFPDLCSVPYCTAGPSCLVSTVCTYSRDFFLGLFSCALSSAASLDFVTFYSVKNPQSEKNCDAFSRVSGGEIPNLLPSFCRK